MHTVAYERFRGGKGHNWPRRIGLLFAVLFFAYLMFLFALFSRDSGAPASTRAPKGKKMTAAPSTTAVEQEKPGEETPEPKVEQEEPEEEQDERKTAAPSRSNMQCVMWRQTADCDATGTQLDRHKDQSCTTHIQNGNSGFCQCYADLHNGHLEEVHVALSSCRHRPFTCKEACKEGTSFDVNFPKNHAVSGEEEICIAFRRTGNCSAHGPREQSGDRGCLDWIPPDYSGFCDCVDESIQPEFSCGHEPFTCADKCAEEYTKAQQTKASTVKRAEKETKPPKLQDDGEPPKDVKMRRGKEKEKRVSKDAAAEKYHKQFVNYWKKRSEEKKAQGAENDQGNNLSDSDKKDQSGKVPKSDEDDSPEEKVPAVAEEAKVMEPTSHEDKTEKKPKVRETDLSNAPPRRNDEEPEDRLPKVPQMKENDDAEMNIEIEDNPRQATPLQEKDVTQPDEIHETPAKRKRTPDRETNLPQEPDRDSSQQNEEQLTPSAGKKMTEKKPLPVEQEDGTTEKVKHRKRHSSFRSHHVDADDHQVKSDDAPNGQVESRPTRKSEKKIVDRNEGKQDTEE